MTYPRKNTPSTQIPFAQIPKMPVAPPLPNKPDQMAQELTGKTSRWLMPEKFVQKNKKIKK